MYLDLFQSQRIKKYAFVYNNNRCENHSKKTIDVKRTRTQLKMYICNMSAPHNHSGKWTHPYDRPAPLQLGLSLFCSSYSMNDYKHEDKHLVETANKWDQTICYLKKCSNYNTERNEAANNQKN